MPQLFDLDTHAEDRAELRALLTDREYAAARRSTIDTHYTDAALVTAMWHGLRQLGFAGGEVLEPGCGSGHFIGLAPDGARMLGVEREPVSAAIAAALYPDATIITGSFADLDAADATFDAVIGNVPFAKVTLHDPRHNRAGHSLHNHFLIKALHLTRPGGTVALLTSRYTMDAVDPAARAELASLADLAGAIRLPSGAHRRAAGTDAVTDLLILRRREIDTPPRVDFATWEQAIPTALGADGEQVPINRYFLDHPEHVLGTLTLGRGPYREDLEVVGELSAVPAVFAAAIDALTTAATERATCRRRFERCGWGPRRSDLGHCRRRRCTARCRCGRRWWPAGWASVMPRGLIWPVDARPPPSPGRPGSARTARRAAPSCVAPRLDGAG